jgi:hypothetical protein
MSSTVMIYLISIECKCFEWKYKKNEHIIHINKSVEDLQVKPVWLNTCNYNTSLKITVTILLNLNFNIAIS